MIDPPTGERVADRRTMTYDPGGLTTHGGIVGMKGSGKTGLGVIFLEEALRAGIPTLVLDPKGDIKNLMLTFPDLATSDFQPWVNEGREKREGVAIDQLAADTTALWTRGLGS